MPIIFDANGEIPICSPASQNVSKKPQTNDTTKLKNKE